MVRPRGLADKPGLVGIVGYELLRGGKILVPWTLAHNAVNNTAKNAFLEAWFNGGSRSSAYYIGLVDSPTFTSFSAGDTIGSHTGWTEYLNYTVGGSGSVRAPWLYAAASGQAITNSSAATFDFAVAAGSVYGIFITADGTKSGTGAILWSTAAFTAPLSVSPGDQLKVTYTVQL
jgi:hypothetical protein